MAAFATILDAEHSVNILKQHERMTEAVNPRW